MNITNQQPEIDLDALKRKDKAAIKALVDQNSDHIYRLALKMLGNQQDAEDILQETFIKAFNNIEGFEGRSKISTWLYRITVNESLMLLRKRKHILVEIDADIETDQGDTIPRQIVDWCCLPEKELMSSEAREHLNHAIQTLSDANRAAFLLRDVEGLSTREAAQVLDIGETAVKVRLMRARMQLREELTAYYSNRIEQKLI